MPSTHVTRRLWATLADTRFSSLLYNGLWVEHEAGFITNDSLQDGTGAIRACGSRPLPAGSPLWTP